MKKNLNYYMIIVVNFNMTKNDLKIKGAIFIMTYNCAPQLKRVIN